ncbi:predicted protein [Chaetoceros tenuissimus]|uniref:Uncharacterized protein n=1 Tax=Chaetoceros tenuissimus TaxID=426638 RepID=A0AAD3H9J5_9STRA|nr:predicted protein [Chaetoceros tenuissimus]
MQREQNSECKYSMLLQEHAKLLLSLMDKTDASRNALEYFDWCQEVEDFTDNSTGTSRNFQGQSMAKTSNGSLTAGNPQKVNDSQDGHYKQRHMKCDNQTRKNGSNNSSITHKSSCDTVPYNNDKGAFKEEAYLKMPEIYRNHTDFYSSSSCGRSYLARTSKEDDYCPPQSSFQPFGSHRVSFDSSSSHPVGNDMIDERLINYYQQEPAKHQYQTSTMKEDNCNLPSPLYHPNCSHRVSFHSSSSSSLGSCEYTKPEENWRPAGNDMIDERLINYYQRGPAKHQYQTSNNAPTIDHSGHNSITSALNDLCDQGDFSLQNMEW